jgi:hypothetical protein
VCSDIFFQFLFKDLFTVPQLLCLGALGQTGLLLLLPARYALVPVAVIFLYSAVTIVVQTIFPSRNSYFNGVAPGRTTAQFPNASYDPARPVEKPLFGSRPASEQVVVFHIGLRYSHPLGPFAPGAKEMTDLVLRMFAELDVHAKKYDCLGASTWRGTQRDRINSTLSVFYFRSIEGLNAFAHDKAHRDAWDWYNSWTKKTGYKHIGIFHEVFAAPAGQWETVYDNMPPGLLGSTNIPVLNEQTGDEEWVLPLVDANNTKLRSQYGRMGKTAGGHKSKLGI